MFKVTNKNNRDVSKVILYDAFIVDFEQKLQINALFLLHLLDIYITIKYFDTTERRQQSWPCIFIVQFKHFRGHSFSTYAKFSEKLTFLNPLISGGKKC